MCSWHVCHRLLMAPHGVITVSKSGEDPGDGGRGWSRGCGLRDAAVLLCPNGHLLSFLIPFPTLVRYSLGLETLRLFLYSHSCSILSLLSLSLSPFRLNDSSSHDAHLLQKLSPALQSGLFLTISPSIILHFNISFTNTLARD